MTSAIIRLAAASVLMRVISWPVGARTISICMPGKRSEKRLDDGLLGVEEVGGVEDDLALLLGRGQQVGRRHEVGLGRMSGACEQECGSRRRHRAGAIAG